MKIFLLSCMCHFAMGFTHCYKTTVFLLTHTQSGRQSNKVFHLAYRSQIWKDLNHLWLKTRGFTPSCAFSGYRWWQIMFRGPNFHKKKHFWVPFNATPIIERALRKSYVNELRRWNWSLLVKNMQSHASCYIVGICINQVRPCDLSN